MEKRFVLAVGLSLLVLLSWSAIAPKQQPLDNKALTKTETAVMPAPQATSSATPVLEEKSLPVLKSLYPFGTLDITFIDNQAAIDEVIFKSHQNYKFILRNGFFLNHTAHSFSKNYVTSESAEFATSDTDKKIIKRFIFTKSNNLIGLEINVQNKSPTNLVLSLPITLGTLDFAVKNNQVTFQDIAVATTEKTTHINGRKDLEFSDLKFLSLRDKYFCAIIAPETKGYKGFIKKIDAQKSVVGIISPEITLLPGQSRVEKFRIYLGPQDLKLLNSINPEWASVINFGTFDLIAQVILQLLQLFYNIVHNWGWAIVLLSVGIYFLLFPLTLKQMRSMKAMQALQPKIEELRKIYKDNPQRMNKEIMELYRQHNVNPFSGCLPLILQMPIFFALYQALMRTITLKGAQFLWIKDLSEPDKLLIIKNLPSNFPVIGNEINILPILMTIEMFLQQKVSMAAYQKPATAASGVDSTYNQQKIMLIIMPLMFGLIFYKMPSGLVLYWFVNSTLMLIFQLKLNRAR